MNILKKSFDILIVFIITFLVFLPRSVNFCDEYIEPNFDTQNLLVWSLSSDLGVMPIRDVHYPYGLIFYYANSINIIYLVYILIAPLIYTSIYIIYKNVFKSNLISRLFLFSIFFIISTGLIPRIHPIDRYIFPLAFSLVIYLINERFKSNLSRFLIGIIAGLFIFYDITVGIIVILLTSVTILYFEIYNHYKYHKLYNINSIISKYSLFILGTIVGVVPYIWYILRFNIFHQFIRFLNDVIVGSSYVKSPIIALSKYNILIFSTIILQSVFFINSIRDKFNKFDKELYFFIFTNYVISIIILQKNFLRQMWVVLMVYSIHALFLMMNSLLTAKNSSKKK